MAKVKLAIADILDRCFPYSCYAELASWALGYIGVRDINLRNDCHIDPPTCGCWCGKFDGNGKQCNQSGTKPVFSASE